MSEVLVVGPGRAGGALAWLHARLGDRVTLLGRRDGLWRRRARRAGIATTLDPGRAGDPDLVLLALPDAGLAAAAAELAAVLPPGRARPTRLVVHVSGLHALAPLSPFRRRGAAVAALHPIYPFPADPAAFRAEGLDGSVVTVLAAAGTLRRANALARAWGGRPRVFSAGADRRRYHLALTLAANHVTALLGWAEELLEPSLGKDAREVVAELAGRAVARCREDGPVRALTGPIARGDLAAVAAHLAALRGAERTRYRGLLEAVVHLAERGGRMPAAIARALRALGRE